MQKKRIKLQKYSLCQKHSNNCRNKDTVYSAHCPSDDMAMGMCVSAHSGDMGGMKQSSSVQSSQSSLWVSKGVE